MQHFDSFAQMQLDAERRVMEMQKRAMAAVEGSDPPSAIIPEPPREGRGSDVFEQHDANQGHNDRETNQKNTVSDHTEGISNESQKSETPLGGLLSGLNLSEDDSERALIIAILLLIREKADRNLIFLLLYLML